MDFTKENRGVVNCSKTGKDAQFAFPVAKNHQFKNSVAPCPLPQDNAIPLFIYPFHNALVLKKYNALQETDIINNSSPKITCNTGGFPNCSQSSLPTLNPIVLPTLPTSVEDATRICCSPESGFGSEHQYSPKPVQMETPFTDTIATTEASNTSVTNNDPKSNNDDFFPQIVSVTSLAKNEDIGTQTNNANHKNTGQNSAQSCNPNSSKRLRLDLDHQKKTILQLDIDSIRQLTSRDVLPRCQKPNAKMHKKVTSEKPQFDFRENIVKGLPALSSFKTLSRHKTVINDNIHVFDLKETFKHPGKVIPSHQTYNSEDITTETSNSKKVTPGINARPCIISKSSSLNELSLSDTALVKEDNSYCNEDNNVLVQQPETNIILPKTTSPSTARPNTKDKKSIQRSEKIKRLKEILKKREEALEVVRRDCGFID